MSSENDLHLLALPTEIRLRIYEVAYSAQFMNKKLSCYTHHLYAGGTTRGTPWTLLRVCRQLHHEIKGALPTISEITFHFHNLSSADMHTWLHRLSTEQVSLLRNLTFSGTRTCKQRRDGSLCERSLIVTLPEDVLSTRKATFNTIVNPPPVQRIVTRYPEAFYKGFFLLRIRDDVVKMPRAPSHPRGSIGQCNSVEAQRNALGEFITLEGELCVRREAVVKLLGAVMRNGIPGSAR